MIPKKQTRLHTALQPVSARGNCFPAVIASLMEVEVEEVLQIQEHYDNPEWVQMLAGWLHERGWQWRSPYENEDLTDKYVLVDGQSPRHPDCTHVVIYLNGKMVHDPHPDNTGILDERAFEIIEKIAA